MVVEGDSSIETYLYGESAGAIAAFRVASASITVGILGAQHVSSRAQTSQGAA